MRSYPDRRRPSRSKGGPRFMPGQKARPVNESPGRACEDTVIGSGGGMLLPPLAVLAEQLHHASVRGVRYLHEHQQVIAVEARGAQPLAILGAVEALERDV